MLSGDTPVRARRAGTLIAMTSALVLCVTGCRQDMHDQPKFFPLRGTNFYADGRSARTQVVGTVARSQSDLGPYLETGILDGKEGDSMPMPVTPELLARGQERYNIYCSPCHSRVGNGEGMIVQRGYYPAANFHSERLRQAPIGHFVNVMANGFGAMPAYNVEVPVADRWAIAAYIRALQLSQHARPTDAANGAVIAQLKQIAEDDGLPEALSERRWGIQPSNSGATFLAGTPSVAATQPKSQTESATTAPSQPAASESTSPASSEAGAPKAESAGKGDPAAGKVVYTANCQMCHQATRTGMPPMIPSLIDIVPRVGEEHIRETVMNGQPDGHPPMPSFGSKLSQTDIDNLIGYLRTAK